MTQKTLRDEFAMAAITGLLAYPNAIGGNQSFSMRSFEIADAMLVARGLPQQRSCIPDGWKIEREQFGGIRVESPEGEAWEWHEAKFRGSFDIFTYRFLSALLEHSKVVV
jgi:hypothetical protein